MKTAVYKFLNHGRNAALGLCLVGVLALFGSCEKEVDWGKLNTEFGNGSGPDVINATVAGNSGVEYLFYCNLDIRWTVEVDYQTTDTEWIEVWPNRGRKDGRFKITVLTNEDDPYERHATVNVVSDGRVLKSIEVVQEPVAPRLGLNMNGKTKVSYGSKGGTKPVYLDTNVVWEAQIPSDAKSWIVLGEYDETTQQIETLANTGSSPRSAIIRFVMVGNESLYVDVEISQRDSSSDAENATLKTIAEVLASLPGGVGEITDNVVIEGHVISDLSVRNLDVMRDWEITSSKPFNWQTDYQKKFMYVQDESGRGLMFEWDDETDNIYALNDKVRIHLIDMSVVVDSYYTATMIDGLTYENIVSREASATGATPVSINRMSDIPNYENSLVKLTDVEFAIPIGTYVNVDDTYFNTLNNTDAKKISSPYFDTHRQYSHWLTDETGDSIRLLTLCTFTERYQRFIPAGKGSITGIVTKRKTPQKEEYVLRLRHDSDNEISTDPSTRTIKPVVQFGPWTSSISRAQVTASLGTGVIKTSMFENVEIASGENMYWACTYSRLVTSNINVAEDGVQSVEVERPEINTDNYTGFYNSCLNQGSWYNMAGTSITDDPGEAWIMTINTEGVTGDLWLAFATSSSQTGPLKFTVEWADTEDAPIAQWTQFFDYMCGNWTTNSHAPQYVCRVPDEVKGKSSVVIRHRVTDEMNARMNGAYGGGTNRMCYWSLGQMN